MKFAKSELIFIEYVIGRQKAIQSTQWPKKVSHYQIIKKIVLNRIKVCQ